MGHRHRADAPDRGRLAARDQLTGSRGVLWYTATRHWPSLLTRIQDARMASLSEYVVSPGKITPPTFSRATASVPSGLMSSGDPKTRVPLYWLAYPSSMYFRIASRPLTYT